MFRAQQVLYILTYTHSLPYVKGHYTTVDIKLIWKDWQHQAHVYLLLRSKEMSQNTSRIFYVPLGEGCASMESLPPEERGRENSGPATVSNHQLFQSLHNCRRSHGVDTRPQTKVRDVLTQVDSGVMPLGHKHGDRTNSTPSVFREASEKKKASHSSLLQCPWPSEWKRKTGKIRKALHVHP